MSYNWVMGASKTRYRQALNQVWSLHWMDQLYSNTHKAMHSISYSVMTRPWAIPCRRDIVETWRLARRGRRAFLGRPDTVDQSACRKSKNTLPGSRPNTRTSTSQTRDSMARSGSILVSSKLHRLHADLH